jgi:hypothetical protein
MPKLTTALERQLKLNESKNLLHIQVEQLIEIDPTFLAALEELLANSATGAPGFNLDEIATDAASALIAKIYAINQYIQVDSQAKQLLKQIYVQSWQKIIATRDIEATLRNDHYPEIKAYLAALYPQTLRDALQTSPNLGHVPCSEYSAELQMHLFRLDLATLKEPLLDIGCGSQAYLVNYLRSQGIEAYGIDRIIQQKTEFLTETDWFELELEPGRWGTVLSNLSFANHLVYAQRYAPNRVPRYMQKYLEILDSLSTGGSFIYAPSVESLEAQTDERKFCTEKWPVSAQYAVTRIIQHML